MRLLVHISFACLFFALLACKAKVKQEQDDQSEQLTAKVILGNSDYQGISYGGFRQLSRDTVASIDQLKEDLLILSALNISVLRTYHSQLFDETARLLEAIQQLKEEHSDFEMFVMLGLWMECKDAFTDHPDHLKENWESNQKELKAGILLARKYPEIVKMIAVGNEAMVHWAPYHLHPSLILKHLLKLQELKAKDSLPADLWITSSDNFASWGGGSADYRTPTLDSLVMAVDFISAHTYPFHDTHYNPDFWLLNDSTYHETEIELVDSAMQIAIGYAFNQIDSVIKYAKSVKPDINVHIGESGWASSDNSFYGSEGSMAADEYKQKLYYDGLRKGSNDRKMSCFYFEAFDEIWKDAKNPMGSENHFGLFTVDGKAKYVIWDKIDSPSFMQLKRGKHNIVKTYRGSDSLLKATLNL